MNLKKQLQDFTKNNPKNTFRIECCEHTKKNSLQVLQREGWLCLHGFYEDNKHFKLGADFDIDIFECFRCKGIFMNRYRSRIDTDLCEYCHEFDDENGELKESI